MKRKPPMGFGLLSLVISLCFSAHAMGDTVVFEQGDGRSLTTDTIIQEANPNADNGNAGLLGVDSDDPRGTGADVQTLLRITQIFGNGPGQVPLEATVESAILELRVTNGGDAFALHAMLSDWEDSTSWDAVADGVQPDDAEALGDPDGVTDWAYVGKLEIDVTASIKRWQADPTTNHGWVILPTGNNGADFHSSEGTDPPRLTVQFVTSESRTIAFDTSAGYASLQDTFLQADPANANTDNGAANALNIDADDPRGTGRDVQALLRFDDIFGSGSGQVPLNSTVDAARLHLQVSNAGHPVALHRMVGGWDDSATWNSMLNGVQTDGSEAQATAEVRTSWVRRGPLVLDVTESIRQWQLDPATNQGWVVMPTGKNGVDLHASAGATPPLLVVQATGGALQPPGGEPSIATVSATIETDSVPSNGDAADDMAIWVHPVDSNQTRIIGTDKRFGIIVYDLDGTEVQRIAEGQVNNVDVLYGVRLDGAPVDLVASSERSSDAILVYRVNPSDGLLEDATAGAGIATTLEVYGLCAYESPVTEDVYVFVTSKSGELEQWVLFDDGTGLVDGSLVRRFDVGTQSEGCAADDEHGVLYVGEEDVGIWRYAAEPDAGESRQLVDQTGAGGHLSADVEGLTLYYASDGGGYLIASSQGDNSYVVYERDGSNDYVGTFEIAPGGGIDGTEITDGVDVTNADLGGAFPYGLFIAQDTYNPGGHQNFKLVPWDTIADAFPTPLTIDTGYR